MIFIYNHLSKTAQNSPMDFHFVEFEWITNFVSVGNLKTHQTDGKKKVETQTYAIEFWCDSQSFVGHLTVLRKEVKKGLVIDEISIFCAGKCVKIAYKTLFIETPHRVPASKPKKFVCR